MPFKPLSNALLNPYKAPFGTQFYNYLITKNLHRLLNNSFLTHFPTFSLHFCQYISGGGVDVGGWVVMMCGFTMNFIETINTHHSTSTTQHPIPHIINTQHSSPITHHSIPHIINTQHPTPIPQHSIPHIINTQHSTPNTQHFPPH